MTPRQDKFHEFKLDHDIFLKTLICAMHVGGGMPARATELESIQVINTDLVRNIFSTKENTVFSLIEHSKTSKLTLSNSGIARFYDEALSEILKNYLIIVRPFILVILHSTGSSTEQLVKLFSYCDRILSADEIRNSFRSCFAKYSGKALNFSDYRQVANYFAHKFVKNGTWNKHSSDDFEIDHDPMTEQSGHSENVRLKNYGTSTNEHVRMRQSRIDEFKICSTSWHRFLLSEEIDFINQAEILSNSQQVHEIDIGIIYILYLIKCFYVFR